MKVLREYIRFLLLKETTDPEFLSAAEDLWGDWVSVQENIPTETSIEPHYGYYWNEETQEHEQDWRDIEVIYQVTKDEKKPPYTDENPEHYDNRHPSERRVKHGQTLKEIDIERAMMRLWQEKADIDFFKSNKMTYTHDVTYKSAARAMGSFGIKITKPLKSQWIEAQETPQKNAISVSATYTPSGNPLVGSQSMMSKGWGFLIEGWPIFAAFTDLASQTQRMASDKAREYYKSSGLPKRAAMTAVSSTKFPEKKKKWIKRKMERKGKSTKEIENYFKIRANAVALNEKDIKDREATGLEEVILDNWKISAWYIADVYRAKNFFEKALKDGSIKKPIYLLENSYMGDNSQKVINPQNKNDVKFLLNIFKKERY